MSSKELGPEPTADKDSELNVDIHREETTSSTTSSSSRTSIESLERPSIHQALSRNAGHDVDAGRSLTQVTTNMTTDPRFEVDFDEGENPQDMSLGKKAMIVGFMSFSTLCVVMYSTSYTSGIPGMLKSFNIQSKTLVVLGITTYLMGLALGSVILAPLSEVFGRRPVYLIAHTIFVLLVIPSALAQNLATILTVRFFAALAGAAMISNSPGTVSDIVDDDSRALAFSIWSIGPMNGKGILLSNSSSGAY
jgi:hypothetical protein